MLSREYFEVLRALAEHPAATQREVAEQIGCELESVTGTFEALAAEGLVDENGITAAGHEALAPYRVENAVIMAAGMSTRFAPVSYEKPKGLLSVRGDILVERQIEQLIAAGIDDIIVVVGYKKELFFYLEDKYDCVRIVINPEFASRNNNSTLMRVRHQLGNTYVCTSDTWCADGYFRTYQYKAYYGVQYCGGDTEEWCVETDDNGRITRVLMDSTSDWYMTDQAYFDRDFSKTFAQILEEIYDDPRTAGKLWEEILDDHVERLDMEALHLPDGTVYEFDSLDKMRDFDPMFLENVDIDIFDNIVEVLGCTKSEIHNVYPLKKGLTNLSCHFATNDGEYVYRHPGVGTEKMIDRTAELQALELAKRIGLDKTFIYQDPVKGWKLSRFIPNCRELDPHDDAQLAEAMGLARRLHTQDAVLDRRFDYLKEGMKYEALLREKGPIEVPGYDELRAQAVRAKELADADGAPVCLTHNDFFDLNLLYDEAGELSLIDWEYAGMSDYASDYGTFVVTGKLDDEEADRALEHYFGRTPTLAEKRHNYVYVGLAGWCWYVWSLQKESEGDYVGDWLYTYYRYAKKYLPLALELYAQGE